MHLARFYTWDRKSLSSLVGFSAVPHQSLCPRPSQALTFCPSCLWDRNYRPCHSLLPLPNLAAALEHKHTGSFSFKRVPIFASNFLKPSSEFKAFLWQYCSQLHIVMKSDQTTIRFFKLGGQKRFRKKLISAF